MGLFDFLKEVFSKPQYPSKPAKPASSTKKLTYVEKELLAVRRTTLADIKQLTGFPFRWNHRLEKLIQPNSHPFAYMDIIGENIPIALSELERMNLHIEHSKTLCRQLPTSLRIPTDKVVFTRSITQGYSRLILSPITHDGNPTNIPVSLSFMTDLTRKDTTHGDIHYGPTGSIVKAELFFWRRGNGYFLYYDTIDNSFVLSRVEDANRTIIYKGKHLLDREANLVKTEQDFSWVQTNLPEQCPKSITSYRRMKTQNTKNFQILKALAAELGRQI